MTKPRGVLIAGNWKMNHGLAETEAFFSEFKKLTVGKSIPKEVQACAIVPYLNLASAQALSKAGTFPVSIGAQSAHWEKKGAFTGEISGPMLLEIHIQTVLVGHSERRQFFGETDESAGKRTSSLLAQGFKVILCVGETRSEREAGRTREVVLRQLEAATQGLKDTSRLVIAYEPVWAIGTGLTATPAQAEEVHSLIREWLKTRFGSPAAGIFPVLYGGSVTPENIDSLLACPNVDGALVGGASLKPDSFLKLIEAGGRAI